MAMADVDRNGVLDFILSNQAEPGGNSTFSVYTCFGTGDLCIFNWTVPVVGPHTRMVVDDVNGDGWPDVAVLASSLSSVQVFLNGGPGVGFWRMKSPSFPFWTPGAVDFAFGALLGSPIWHDLAVVYPDGVAVYNYIGAPSFYDRNSRQNLTDSAGYAKIAITDADGDGQPDLVLANPSEIRTFFWRAGQIHPNCAVSCGVYEVAGNQTGDVSLATADVTSDSKQDIVLAVSDWMNRSGILVVFAGNGDLIAWNFTEVFRDSHRDFTTEFTIADLNGDGSNDVAIVLYSAGGVAFYYQHAGGTFGRVDLLLEGTASSGMDEEIASGDFNVDGYQDVVLRSPTTLSFYYQEDHPVELKRAIPSTCPSDCFYFNQGASGYHLIDLSNYFSDDHGPIAYSIVSPQNPNLLASLDGSYLSFTATDGWSGKANFTVAANDGYFGHTPTATNITVMVNARPIIASTPSAEIFLGDEYLYQPIVTDAYPPGDYHAFALLAGPAGMSIDYNSGAIRWRPPSLGNFTVSIQATDSLGAESAVQTFTFVVVQRPEQPPTTPLGLPIPRDATGIIAVGAVFATLVLLAAIIAINENAKYGLLLTLIPLYSKIKREKVLDHFIRGQIFGYIMANPGEHYNSIKLALDITNGSLAHHLRTLEREQFVKSKRFGLYRRFYPWAMRVPEDGYFQLNEIQKNVLDLCRHQPGVSQKELAASLNLTPPTINYHIAILAEHGYVSVIRRGRKTHVYLLKGANDEARGQVPH